MRIQKTKNILQYLTVLTVAVVLLLSVAAGLSSGKKASQSKAVASDARELAAGLEYFYADQGRFPSALEFSNPDVMSTYFSVFPPAEYPDGNCRETYSYRRLSAKNFELGFCLPDRHGSFQRGWNRLTVSE